MLGLAQQRSHLLDDARASTIVNERSLRDATHLLQSIENFTVAVTSTQNAELVFTTLSLAGICSLQPCPQRIQRVTVEHKKLANPVRAGRLFPTLTTLETD